MHKHAITLFIMNKRTLELTRLHSEGLVGVTGAPILTSGRGPGVLHLLLQNLTAELMRVAKGRGLVPICGQTKENMPTLFVLKDSRKHIPSVSSTFYSEIE